MKEVGILVASDKTMKANGLETLTVADAEKDGVFKLSNNKISNDNANADTDGYYTFGAKITSVNNVNADKEIYAIAYAVMAGGNVLYSANGYAVHLDV